jgi:hypothetical protein
MKPLRISEAETVVLGLQDEIRRSEESRYDHRLHGVLLVAQGMSCRQVSELLGDAPRTVAYWVRRFESDVLTGLTEEERPGRPRRLNEEHIRNIDAAPRMRSTDEVHFQQHGSRCRRWIPPETSDPVLRHHPTRRSVGYFGAVRLRDGKLVYRREPKCFNAEMCFTFLQQLWTVSLYSDRRAVVITDNARYHHVVLHKEWRETAAPWFQLKFLPPNSPDMNPIERVWKLTRRIATHNRYVPPAIEDVMTAVENTLHQWRNGNDALRRLCAIT